MLKQLIIRILFFAPILVSAQGDIFYKNYYRADYGNAHVQNWDITQDNRGLIYVANELGVLEFDGIKWKLLNIEGEAKCRSLHKSSTGKIYVGGYAQFGYLSTNTLGELSYVSLSNKIDESHINSISLVEGIESTDTEVYFLTDRMLYIYDIKADSISGYVTSKQEAKSLLKIENTIIFNDALGNYYRVKSDKTLEQQDWIKDQNSGNDIIDCVQKENFVFVGKKDVGVVKFSQDGTPLDTLISLEEFSALNILHNNQIMVDVNNELQIFNSSGEKVFTFNQLNGKINADVNNVFEDYYGNFWIATDNGISFVQYSSPIRKLNKNLGVSEGIEAMEYFNNSIFVATSEGLIKKGENDNKFHAVKNMDVTAWNLDKIILDDKEALFASMDDGLYQVHSDDIIDKITSDYVWSVRSSTLFPNTLFESTSDGIELLSKQDNNWKKTGRITALNFEIRFFEIEGDSIIWCANDHKLLVKYEIKNRELNKGKVIVCDSLMGKRKTANLWPKYIGDSLIFYGDDGIFNYRANHFKKVSWFNDVEYSNIHRVESDGEYGLWIVHFNERGQFRITHITFEGGVGSSKFKEFMPLTDNPTHDICSDGNNTWFGGPEHLFKLANEIKPRVGIDKYQTLIRSIHVGKDSLIFGGNVKEGEELTSKLKLNQFESLKYKYNSIEVVVASNFYSQNEKQEFSYLLEGYDETWSKWTHLPNIKYTNLHEGEYKLRVRAKNCFDDLSKEAIFSFEVLPPFWRTIWAYLGYVVLLFGGFAGYTNIRTRKLKAEQERLEGIVVERTAEITEKSEKLEVAFDEIQEQKGEIERQHEVLEEHHKEITDSIDYAKGIQESILPSLERVKELFPKSFVLFRPKDVVSGDFFWAEENEEWRYITASDCTGHGVPGAFVSMVGANGLSRSVNEYKIVEPAKILDKLTDLVEETFSQRKDGMDISLIALNRDSTKIQWAGAHNPLWILRKESEVKVILNDKEIEPNLVIDGISLFEIKANKQPVGLFEYREDFKNNIIKVLPGDRCYSFTDGYPDQFGGEKGKKYMSKNMKKLFIEFFDAPIEEQHTLLEKVFEDWIQGHEQIDDVCIVGIEV